MEMSNTELLIEEIKTLPPERVAEALDFVEFLKQKEAACQKAKGRIPISRYFGVLSPDTYGDGVVYQRKLRDEWND
jgi:hypothetical protein